MRKITKKELVGKCAELAGRNHDLRCGVKDALYQLRQINGELHANKSMILNIALASIIRQFRAALHESEES